MRDGRPLTEFAFQSTSNSKNMTDPHQGMAGTTKLVL